MATAPDWTAEEKKRRKGLGRDVYTGIPSVDFVLGANERGARATLGTIDAMGDRFNELVNRDRTPAEAPAPPPSTPPANQRMIRGRPGQDSLGDSTSPDALRAAGLTRIVKTGEGAYTDNPNATGEVRYYNVFGNRADTGDVATPDRNLPGPEAVRQFHRNEQAAALDLSDPNNAVRVLEAGRLAQRQMGARQTEIANRADMEFLASLAPEDRAKMTTARIKESGLDRRAEAANAIALRGQQAAMINAQGTQAQRQFENDLNLSDRLNNPETRDAEIGRILAPLKGLSRQEVTQVLADPNNTPIQAAIAALELKAREQNQPFLGLYGGVGDNFDFGDVTEGLFGGYKDQNTFLGGGIDPQQLSPYLDDETLQALIDARRTQSSRNRGR